MSHRHPDPVVGHRPRGLRRETRPLPHRGLALRLLTILALLLTALVTAPTVSADSGIEVASTSRYVLDTQARQVTGTMSITLRNTTPNAPTGDGGYRYFFYNTYGVPLPAAATDIRARSGGATLRVERQRIDGDPGYRMVAIRFPDLLYQASRTIELTFALVGQPPRADDPTRIGQGYATFPVFGPGDRGRSTVEVVLPRGVPMESTATGWTESDEPDGTTVHTTTEDNLSPGFSAMVSVRTEEIGQGRDVTVGGVPMTLLHYPNDTEWADFIETWADTGLPELEALVGRPWPGDIDRIRQDSGAQVRGFDGWFSTSDREIVLGESLDEGVLFHELAHAWTTRVDERWIGEGLAEVLAERTAARTNGSFTAAQRVASDAEHAVPLDSWVFSPGFRANEVDAWAYPASHQVMTGLLSGLDDEALSSLLSDAVTATSPWDAPGRDDLSGGKLTSRALLDLLDAHETPSTQDGSSPELYRTWVLDETGLAALAARETTGPAYAAYASQVPWATPLGLRRAMARWEFDTATALLTALADLPGSLTAVVDLAERTGTDLDGALRERFEIADDERAYAAVSASLSAARGALESYEVARAALDADRNVLARLGATVLQVDRTAALAQDEITFGDYAASGAASEQVIERTGQATLVGAGVVAAAVLALLALTLSVRAIRRAWRRGRAPALAPSSQHAPAAAPPQ